VVGLEVVPPGAAGRTRTKGGDLLARHPAASAAKLTQELGFLVQPVHIRDNLELGPNSYRIRLAGVAIGESVVHPDRELAINPGRVFGPLNGLATRDPAFGMEAVWIEPACANTRSRWVTPWSTRPPSSPRTCRT
jgi:flagellar biosynthesis protein FlhA